MEKNNKQNLISLSLVGAIGYYLYSKMAKFNSGKASVDVARVADEKTKEELSWHPEEVVEMVNDLIVEDEIVEEVVEEVIAEEAVEEIAEEAVEEAMEEVVAEEEIVEEEDEEIEEVKISGKLCEACGGENAAEAEICEFCGNQFVIEEVADEDEVAEEAIEEEVEEVVEEVEEVEEAIVPVLTFDEGSIELPEAAELPEIQSSPLFDDEVKEEEEEDEDETPVDDLFGAVEEAKPEEPQLMENVEPLHKVDQKDSAAKKEYKSILDFFAKMDEKD